MTLKEKVAQMQPDMIDEDLSGGVDGCPGNYYYLNKFGLDVTTCNRNIKCKALQNWKYLISSDIRDGMYYEITYNGREDEFYLDAYKKFENRVVKPKYD